MNYDQFTNAGVRWLAADDKVEFPAPSKAASDAQSPSPPSCPVELEESGFPIHLYSNRGFRLRIEWRATCVDDSEETAKSQSSTAESQTDDSQSDMASVSLSMDQATSFDWDNQEWNDWRELKQVDIKSLNELLVNIAEWSTWLGEEDKTAEADVHAMLNEFME
jgi:hypothetical protein